MVGKLQSNKSKEAHNLFNYIHSLDSEKLALVLDKEEAISLKKVKYFIQVNVGNEPQKNGISINKLNEFINWLKSRRYSENTISTYTDCLKTFLKFFTEKPEMFVPSFVHSINYFIKQFQEFHYNFPIFVDIFVE